MKYIWNLIDSMNHSERFKLKAIVIIIIYSLNHSFHNGSCRDYPRPAPMLNGQRFPKHWLFCEDLVHLTL